MLDLLSKTIFGKIIDVFSDLMHLINIRKIVSMKLKGKNY